MKGYWETVLWRSTPHGAPAAAEKAHEPADAAILERAVSLATEAMHTVALQRRRVRSSEPEDEVFLLRYWADLQFLIVALRRLRRAAELAAKVPAAGVKINRAIATFDAALPMLQTMRNVGEHIDDYARDNKRRRDKEVTRYQLQVGEWDGTTHKWLDQSLNVDEAHAAALSLYSVVQKAATEVNATPS